MHKIVILFGILIFIVGCQENSKINDNQIAGRIDFETDEGTWMNLDVSPDGKTILFDLLGDIYTLPINGGKATPLRVGMSWDVAPKFSPNGENIVFASDFTGGYHQLCVMKLDGTNTQEISHEEAFHGAPIWLNDSTITGSKSYDDRTFLKQYSTVNSSANELPKKVGWFHGPTFSQKEEAIYYTDTDKNALLQVFRIDKDNNVAQITKKDSLICFRPQLSNDGKWLAYGSINQEFVNNDIGNTSLVIRNMETGVERVVVNNIDYVRVGITTKPFDIFPGYAFTPNGKSIIIAYKGKIHSIDVVTGSDKIIPFTVNVSKERTGPNQIRHSISLDTFKVRQIHSPTFHPNGEEVVFTAVGKLWSHNMRDGSSVRLTKSAVKEFTPKFSPDGLKMAYVTWSDEQKGSIMVYDLRTKMSQRVSNKPGFYINPTWSPDGSTLTFIAAFDKNKTYEELCTSESLGIYSIRQFHEPPTLITKYKKLDVENLLSYSPLYFDKTGEHLFYSDHSGSFHNILYRVNLKKKSRDTVMEVPKTINYISPSPDGSKAILVGNYGLYVFEGLDKLTTVKKLKFDDVYGERPEVKVLSNSSATIVEWQKDGSLLWNFTNELYKWKPENTEPTLVSNIDLVLNKRKPETQETVYKNARIITMDDPKVIANGYIKIANGRIKEIGEMATFRPSKHAQIIDCSGKTIMPGLIDIHAHFHYSNNVFTDIKQDYIANLAYGVTTIFDPAAFTNTAFTLAELVESGTVVGPRIFSAGAGVMNSKYHWGHAPINSLEDAKNVVGLLKQSGATMVKSYIQPRRDQKQWLIEAVKESDIGITLESGLDQMNYFTGMLDGHNAIEHDPLYMPIYDDVVNFYAKSGVQITTTFGIDNVAPVFFAKEGYVPDRKLERFMDPKRLKKYHSETKVESAMEFIQTAKDLKKVIDQGGKISLGSHGEFAGIAMHWELWLAAMGDWSPMQVLEAATIVGAEKIGYDTEIGSIETGKIADLLILNSNPLDDIRNTAHIQYVIKEGVVYDAASMTQLYPEYKTLPKPEWLNEEQWKTYKNPIPFNE